MRYARAGRRARVVRPAARLTELAASTLIRVGGIGTIASVALILVFLVWIVAPLFLDARADARSVRALDATAPGNESGAPPLLAGVDDRKRIGWRLARDGQVCAWSLEDGQLLEARSASDGLRPTACCGAPEGDSFVLGFEDGRVRAGRIGFHSEIGPDGQLRRTSLELQLTPPVQAFDPEGGSPAVVALDRSPSNTRDSLLVLAARGELALLEIEKREDMVSGEIHFESTRHRVPLELPPGERLPERVLLNEAANGALVLWSDGRLQRYDLSDPEHTRLVQSCDVVEGGATLTCATFLIGKSTLVVGDSSGALSAWFVVKPSGSSGEGGGVLVRGHELAARGPALRALAVSARGRVLAAADDGGSVRLWNVTNDRLLLQLPGSAAAVLALALAPKEDGLLALRGAGAQLWDLDLRHPEASPAALFAPVWYEGAEQPEQVWQSSSGTDSFEPKLGLWPLIFGTLKATLYSMVFAVPIALLAALYTSQFLSARVRAPVKAAVEMMASLPSVVLGFLAGIVVAPYVDRVVPALLLSFACVPFALLCGAQLARLLPEALARRVHGTRRLALTALGIGAGLALALTLAPAVERALFAGDFKSWLDGRVGSAFGGWMLLALPPCAALVAWGSTRALGPWLQARSADWESARTARLHALVFLAAALAALALAALVALGLEGLGLDARGGVFDTYVQRNSLIVGIMMGFAVIPIVFTIADDALSAVPAHLKLASIGAGATPWQTAVRVVLPTAMSGIFSAVMVGLGRAVGETMIVLMATGNTPVTSWNVFDGFRTLSANIAVELPEAVQNSTHYRTLFLAALCLFALTFVFNTLAEIVRQRYRARAARL